MPRATEPSCAAVGLVERVGLFKHRLKSRRDNHLGDAVAAIDDEILRAVIDQNHFQLAAVIGVDRARRVDAGYAEFRRKPRARAHLRLPARRQRNRHAGRHHRPFAGFEHHWRTRRRRRAHIAARRQRGFIGRRRQIGAMGEALKLDAGLVRHLEATSGVGEFRFQRAPGSDAGIDMTAAGAGTSARITTRTTAALAV